MFSMRLSGLCLFSNLPFPVSTTRKSKTCPKMMQTRLSFSKYSYYCVGNEKNVFCSPQQVSFLVILKLRCSLKHSFHSFVALSRLYGDNGLALRMPGNTFIIDFACRILEFYVLKPEQVQCSENKYSKLLFQTSDLITGCSWSHRRTSLCCQSSRWTQMHHFPEQSPSLSPYYPPGSRSRCLFQLSPAGTFFCTPGSLLV